MLTVSAVKTEDILSHGGIPAVRAEITVPCFTGGSRVSTSRINRFYRRLADKYRADIRRKMLPAAARVLDGMENPEAFVPFSVTAEYTVADLTEDLLSVFVDVTEKTGEGRGVVSRRADTWSVLSGLPVTLEELFDRRVKVKKECLRLIDEQISDALSNRTCEYFTNYRKLIRRRFDKEAFFVKDGEVIVFYGQDVIAPRYEGFPLFPVCRLFRGCGAGETAEKEREPNAQ